MTIDFTAFLLGFWLYSCTHPKGNKIDPEAYVFVKETIHALNNNNANNGEQELPQKPSLDERLTADENDFPLDPDDVYLLNRFKSQYDEILDFHINAETEHHFTMFFGIYDMMQCYYRDEWCSPYQRFKNQKLDRLRQLILDSINLICDLLGEIDYFEQDDDCVLTTVFYTVVSKHHYIYRFKPNYNIMQNKLKDLKILLDQFSVIN